MTDTVDRFRASTIGWLLGSLAGWGTLVLIAGGLLATFYFSAQGTLAGAALLAPAILVAGLAILAVKWFMNLAITYEITRDRLVLHKGILIKSIDEIELFRIKDTRLDFSIVNQLAGIGTICVTSSDETTRGGPLMIRDIARAKARREELRALVNEARRLRGVREIDFADEHVHNV